MPSAKRPCYEAATAGSLGPVSGGLPCFYVCVCCCVLGAESGLVHFHPVGGCCLRGAGVHFPFITFGPNLLSRVAQVLLGVFMHSPGRAVSRCGCSAPANTSSSTCQYTHVNGAPHNGDDLIFPSRAGLMIPNFQ